jgi:hypothetical protein
MACAGEVRIFRSLSDVENLLSYGVSGGGVGGGGVCDRGERFPSLFIAVKFIRGITKT